MVLVLSGAMCLVANFFVAVRLLFRARFGALALLFLVFFLAFAFAGAQFSGRQPATVALDIGISFIRLCLPVLGVLALQEIISLEFQRRYFMVAMTYPSDRTVFLVGRVAALVVLLGFLLFFMAFALVGLVSWIEGAYEQGTPVALGKEYWIAILFIFLDLVVVLSVVSVVAVCASTPNFVLVGGLGFVLIARSFSSIISLLQGDEWLVGDFVEAYNGSLTFLSYIVPDLGALDVRAITLYGRMEFLPSNWLWSVLSCSVYAVTFFLLAVWALNRKRFQ